MVLRKIHLEQSKTEHITSNAGLSLIGQAIRISQLEAIVPKKSQPHGVVDRDILKSYIGLACLGKNDFEAIENYKIKGTLPEWHLLKLFRMPIFSNPLPCFCSRNS